MATCASVVTVEAHPANILDDEIIAFALQLEEVGVHGKDGKGKFPAGSPPDNVVAFDDFHAELLAHLNILRDVRLAHSIANAVDADGDIIAKLAGTEEQAHRDRDYALQLSGVANGHSLDQPGPSTSFVNRNSNIPPWFTTTTKSTAQATWGPTDNSESTQPITYTERQANAYESL